MHPIQKQLDRKDGELPKQISKILDNKKIPQTERKKSKIRRRKLYHKIKKKNLHIDNHRDFKNSHEKITKLSSRNLKF